jgi:hypothetical protein
MYLGNSDGSAPFFDGVIEYNLVTAPIGYAIQIKHQMPRPPLDGMPRGRHVTIIRHNVLSKTEGGSTGRDAQPNLLLGHWPLSGEGMTDEYHVYGNFLDGNPNEALFQAEGNVAFYANVLRNRQGPGIVIMPHNDVPREIRIFGNTIVTSGRPISVRVNSRTPEKRQFVFGNLIYSPLPIRGGVQSGNAVFPLEADAGNLLNYMNPAPAARCPSPDDAWIREATDAGCDFNGQPRTTGQCGAYSGSSRSPGWTPTLDIKPRTQCRIR